MESSREERKSCGKWGDFEKGCRIIDMSDSPELWKRFVQKLYVCLSVDFRGQGAGGLAYLHLTASSIGRPVQ